ncbi:MtnX-like HAD-IB family phosphatase [Rhizobium helianthi]|uniref:MtnX-like HAD-IB family phosphatase n=1 Tax=Rhizobium helianthi TaxID=1132695 RepID=A0ABW4M9C8_9HYPH
MHAFCDFDGTIAIDDVTDLVLERFASDDWKRLEEEWQAGRLSAAECMRSQIPLIDASLEDLNAFLDTVEIDPAFPDFVAFCRRHAIGLTVVSDGVDYFIRRILGRYGITDITIIANRLSSTVSQQNFRYRLDTPHARSGCASGAGVCKCTVVQTSDVHFYVGDGRSDFCVSRQASLVFAKSKLAQHCEQQGIPFVPYESFADVQCPIASLLNEMPSGATDFRLTRTA